MQEPASHSASGAPRRRPPAVRRSLAFLFVLGALSAAGVLAAPAATNLEEAGATPTVAFLTEAIAEGAETAGQRRLADRSVLLCQDTNASLLDSYVSQMMAAHLRAEGLKVGRFTARLPRSAGRPEPLPETVLRALRNAPATTFVVAAAPLDGAQRYLAVDLYDVGSAAVKGSIRTRCRLSEDQAALLTRDRQRMNPPDADWLTLLDEAFRTSAPPAPRGPTAIDLAEAGFLFDAGLWDVAARRYLVLAPPGANVCFMRGVFALRLAGKPDEAIRLTREARRDRPESGPLCALLAWLSLRGGRDDDAVLLLEQARLSELSDTRREGLYRYAEGLMALEAGNDAVAEARLSMAAGMLPEDSFAQFQLARFHRNRGRLEQAVAVYRRALQIGSPSADDWAEMALALRALGKQDEALAAFQQAFEAGSDNVAINRQLATVLRLKGRHEEALTVLRKAAEAHPHEPAILAAYGDGALEMWRIDEARKTFENAVAVDGVFPYATARLARILAVRHEYRKARGMLEDLLARQPDYQPARVELGALLGKIGMVAQAVSVLQAVTVSPAYEADARLALTEVYMDAGNEAEAIACAQIAASSRPDARTYSALSRAFLAAKDVTKAEKAARTALEQDAHSAEAHLSLANVLHAMGMDEEAERELGAALAADPFSVSALAAAGRFALDRGDARGCVEFWRRALALDPWNATLHHDIGGVLGLKFADWAAVKEHMVKWTELEAMRTEAAD